MSRLTLARKIATIVLVWKMRVCFDAQHLKPQTAYSILGCLKAFKFLAGSQWLNGPIGTYTFLPSIYFGLSVKNRGPRSKCMYRCDFRKFDFA